ncbi:MAG: IPTL-CTERM sorting domain-containing protein [Methylococcus sp.]|nr:MAG: IPTL-CTERM sorting domain-containing protein [Methylococcus sp.]
MSGLLAAGKVANAAASVIFTETAGNVVVTFSGSIKTAALTAEGVRNYQRVIWPAQAGIKIGDINGTTCNEYSGIAGPTNWGGGGSTPTSSASGNTIAIFGGGGYVCVPIGYSGGNLSGTSTYNGTSLASLGLTVNTYTYTWGSGLTADSLTLYIGTTPPTPSPAPIPTLSEWAQIIMMFLMILTVGWYGRRLKQR